ncbi:MAG: diacylglycerol/lipid kinase family protein [Gammaproteobacteria bacterium]
MNRYAIIINDAAGSDSSAEVRARIAEAFHNLGSEAHFLAARSGEEIVDLARAAVARYAGPVVAGGGDGTINAVASVLIETDRTLGVLPLGTLNHFAKDLNIPLALEESVRTLLEGTVAQVDVGEVNGRFFLNNSGLGLYPMVVRHREKLQDRLGHGKWPAFLWAALSVLRRYPFLAVRVNADDHESVRRTPFIFIGNNEYEIAGFEVGTRKRLDAGRLCLYMARRTGRLGLLRFALRALAGNLQNDKDFDALCTEEVYIETKRARVYVAIDGEVTVMPTPLHYRLRPRALRVLVPAIVPAEQRTLLD